MAEWQYKGWCSRCEKEHDPLDTVVLASDSFEVCRGCVRDEDLSDENVKDDDILQDTLRGWIKAQKE